MELFVLSHVPFYKLIYSFSISDFRTEVLDLVEILLTQRAAEEFAEGRRANIVQVADFQLLKSLRFSSKSLRSSAFKKNLYLLNFNKSALE
jgi:hypothetical protein